MTKPIKRHSALQPLSREHHHSLLLCWKIRQGFKKNIPVERIKQYADWYWEHQLTDHFKEEETVLFPILGNDNKLVKKAITEHRRLRRLFEEEKELTKSLGLIEEELDRHIRFEERVLFNEIQSAATPEQLQDLENHQNREVIKDDWEDPFWEV